MAKVERRGIQSIEVGGRLLTALVRSNGPVMLRDLASEADLAPAQAHAYLSSFRRTGLIEQDNETGRYVLGPTTLKLGLARMKSTQPLQRTSVEAAELSRRLGLMVTVVVWGPHAPTTVQVHEGTQSLNINVRPGTTFNVTGSACGRVFGAYDRSPVVAARIEAEFNGSSPNGIGPASSRDDFVNSLVSVRELGYCGISDSPVPGLCMVSAPVCDIDGKLQLALSLIGSNEAVQATEANAAVKALLSLTRQLSAAARADGVEGKVGK